MTHIGKVNAGIIGLGSFLPDKELSNFDLEKMVDTTNEWILKRTGISNRRIIDKNMPSSEMGFRAAEAALEDAGLRAEDLDLIIVATETPDYLTPSMACALQNMLNATKAAAFDLNAACSGFVYALSIAKQYIITGHYKYILVVGCECLTRITDWKDRKTCVLFGDGAGAAILGPVEKDYGILSTDIGAEGSLGRNITIPCCYINEEDIARRGDERRVLWMDGGEVFKFAVRVMAQATEKVVKEAGLRLDEIALVFPHQANIRILEGAAKKLGIGMERVYVNVHKYGNISSASIPVALSEAAGNKLISKGDNLVLVGFGGGLTWGAAALKWYK